VKPLQNLNTTTSDTIVHRRHKKSPRDVYQNDGFNAYVARSANYLLAKRSFDIFFSTLIILVVLSWLLPVLGSLIKLSSQGPVFFKQRRVGRNGKSFMCLKLRTMIINMEADETPAQDNDYRITKLGSFLRQAHLDELPQFFNVLTGHMSIVGPRPHMAADCIRFSFVIPSYEFRHSVKPGITGWAQVKGYHGPTSNYESIINRYYWDAQYVRKAGLWLDVKIVTITISRIVRQTFRLVFLLPVLKTKMQSSLSNDHRVLH